MANEISNEILKEIRDQNEKLLRTQMASDAAENQRHAESLKAQKDSDKLQKKEVEMTGVGAQFEKRSQHQQEKTVKALSKDGPIKKEQEKTKSAVVVSAKEARERAAAKTQREETQFAKTVDLAEQQDDVLKQIAASQQTQWIQDAKGRVNEMASLDSLKGSIKSDMSIIFGALGGLTSLPGIQTAITGVKFILANIGKGVAWLWKKAFGKKFSESIMSMGERIDDLKLDWGLLSKQEHTDRKYERSIKDQKPMRERRKEADELVKQGKISAKEANRALSMPRDKKGRVMANPEGQSTEDVISGQWKDLKEKAGLERKGFMQARQEKKEAIFKKAEWKANKAMTTEGSIYAHDSKLYDLFKMPMKLLHRYLLINIADKRTGGAAGKMMGGAAKGAGGILKKVGGAISGMLSGLMTAISVVAGGIATMVAGITAPVWLIVGGLLLLGIGLYLAWDWVKEKWNAGVEKLKSFGAVAAQWFSDAGTEIGLRVKMIIARMKDGIASIGNSIIEGINEKKKAWFGGDDIIDFRFQTGAVAGVQAERNAFEAEKASRGQELADGTTALNEVKDKQGLPSAVAGGPNITSIGGDSHTHQGAVLVTREGAADPLARELVMQRN